MKKFTSFFLVLVLVALLISGAACNGGGSSSSTADQTTSETPGGATYSSADTSEDTTMPDTTLPPTDAPILFDSVKINGVALSEYKIVYSTGDSAYSGYTLTQLMNIPGNFYEQCAARVSELFSTIAPSGNAVGYSAITSTKNDYEIVVGRTTRSSLTNTIKLKDDNYVIAVDGTRLIISGGTYGNTWHAVDYFIEYLQAQANAGVKELNLTGAVASGTHHLTTVACVGDSITAGAGASAQNAFPLVMQRIMWKDYTVINYGNSGKTMRDDLKSEGKTGNNESYRATSEYTKFIANMENVDIVLIMLGTNDSNRVAKYQAWNADDDAKYISDYKKFISTAQGRSGESGARFVIMNCPVYYGNDMFGSERVRNLQYELYEYYQDKSSYDVGFFDMYTFTKEKLGRSCFPDSLHPNDTGAVRMATRLAELLTTDK